ncbi:MAG: hypothetical protein KIT16_24200, partial [Rhodospirillaceae bacterium]|nr:hypothetical protein [Rhodospirillaceae bacterium]
CAIAAGASPASAQTAAPSGPPTFPDPRALEASWPAQSRLLDSFANRPPADGPAIEAWIAANQLSLAPPLLFELAKRTFPRDRAQGLVWFVLAYVRTQYDALRCADASARRRVALMALIAGEALIGHASANPDALHAAMRQVLVRPDLFSGRATTAWICAYGTRGMESAIDKRGLSQAELVVPESEWPAIRARILAENRRAAGLP